MYRTHTHNWLAFSWHYCYFQSIRVLYLSILSEYFLLWVWRAFMMMLRGYSWFCIKQSLLVGKKLSVYYLYGLQSEYFLRAFYCYLGKVCLSKKINGWAVNKRPLLQETKLKLDCNFYLDLVCSGKLKVCKHWVEKKVSKGNFRFYFLWIVCQTMTSLWALYSVSRSNWMTKSKI